MTQLPVSFRPVARLLVGLVLPAALLAGCAQAPQESRSEQAQYNACRQQVDRVVVQQNQDILSQPDPVSSPFGGSSTLMGSTNTLVVQHQRNGMMSDCLNHLDTAPSDTGSASAYPSRAMPQTAPSPAPADLAGPSGSDLAAPPALQPGQ